MAGICSGHCVSFLRDENSVAQRYDRGGVKQEGEDASVPFCRCADCGATYRDTNPDGAMPVKGGILWVCTAQTPEGVMCNALLPTQDYTGDDLENVVRFHCPHCQTVWDIEEWALRQADLAAERKAAAFGAHRYSPF